MKEFINLSLKESNFNTALSVQNELNKNFGQKIAVATDSRTIKLMKPQSLSMVEFLARSLDVNVKYEKERGTIIVSNPSDGITRTTTWTGKIALPYPSDYGYYFCGLPILSQG